MSEKPGKLKPSVREKPVKPKPSVREKPGKPREQPNIKENMNNVSYKRDWFACEENRN